MTEPKRKGGYEIREIGGNILLTVRAPRDGMNRNTSASDLTILFQPGEFNAFVNEAIWLRSGLNAERK